MALGWANAWEDYKTTGEAGYNRQDRKMWLCNGHQQPPRTNCFSLQGTAGCLSRAMNVYFSIYECRI